MQNVVRRKEDKRSLKAKIIVVVIQRVILRENRKMLAEKAELLITQSG
tara:strand:+ start:13377 stop:13520 length:144 start_codon:yes stop_codon:yes gene_type:complete